MSAPAAILDIDGTLGDHLVRGLCGDAVEDELGEDIRAAEKALYMAVIEEVAPLEGALALMEDLKRWIAASFSPRRPSPTRSSTTSTCSTPAAMR